MLPSPLGRLTLGVWLATSFVSGAVVMSLEMVAFRLYAPYFGYSIYVWGNMISVVLAALAVGYATSGALVTRVTVCPLRPQSLEELAGIRGQRVLPVERLLRIRMLRDLFGRHATQRLEYLRSIGDRRPHRSLNVGRDVFPVRTTVECRRKLASHALTLHHLRARRRCPRPKHASRTVTGTPRASSVPT